MKVAEICGLLSIVGSLGLVSGFTMHEPTQLVRREIARDMDQPELGAAENATYGLDSNAMLTDGGQMEVGAQKNKAPALASNDANYHSSYDKMDGTDDNSNKFDGKVDDNLDMKASTDRALCPQSHQYAFGDNYAYCCRTDREKVYAPLGMACDGSTMHDDGHLSRCCENDDYRSCASPPCYNFEPTALHQCWAACDKNGCRRQKQGCEYMACARQEDAARGCNTPSPVVARIQGSTNPQWGAHSFPHAEQYCPLPGASPTAFPSGLSCGTGDIPLGLRLRNCKRYPHISPEFNIGCEQWHSCTAFITKPACPSYCEWSDDSCKANPCDDVVPAPANGAIGDCTHALASGSTCQPTCNSGFTVSGPTECSMGTLMSATCQPTTCDATLAPANGAIGDCTHALAWGSTCQPICNTGFDVSGHTECSGGTLLSATCQAPSPWILFSDTEVCDGFWYPSAHAHFGGGGGQTGGWRNAYTPANGGEFYTAAEAIATAPAYCATATAGDSRCSMEWIGVSSKTGQCYCVTDPTCSQTGEADNLQKHEKVFQFKKKDCTAFIMEATCPTRCVWSDNACMAKTCDATSAPANGAIGDCTHTLASGSTCQPTCNSGYTVSGSSYCIWGTLTSATCQVTCAGMAETCPTGFDLVSDTTTKCLGECADCAPNVQLCPRTCCKAPTQTQCSDVACPTGMHLEDDTASCTGTLGSCISTCCKAQFSIITQPTTGCGHLYDVATEDTCQEAARVLRKPSNTLRLDIQATSMSNCFMESGNPDALYFNPDGSHLGGERTQSHYAVCTTEAFTLARTAPVVRIVRDPNKDGLICQESYKVFSHGELPGQEGECIRECYRYGATCVALARIQHEWGVSCAGCSMPLDQEFAGALAHKKALVLAGQYHVYYNGVQQANESMTVLCDNTATGFGFGADQQSGPQEVQFSGAATKCGNSSPDATMYIEHVHGPYKYECLSLDGANLKGSQYTGAGLYHGNVEYKLISATNCEPCSSWTTEEFCPADRCEWKRRCEDKVHYSLFSEGMPAGTWKNVTAAGLSNAAHQCYLAVMADGECDQDYFTYKAHQACRCKGSQGSVVFGSSSDMYRVEAAPNLHYLPAARKHCLRRETCKDNLVNDRTYTLPQVCECEWAAKHGIPEVTWGNTSVVCAAWNECLQADTDYLYERVLFLFNQAGMGNQPSLLQQSVGPADAPGCLNISAMDTEELQCDCWAVMEATCTQNGTVELLGDDLYDCMVQLLCQQHGVCDSWKMSLKADGTPMCDTVGSLVSFHGNGKAEQTRQQDVEIVADAVHARRQPPTNSSSEPMVLEDSVSGKCATKSAR